MRTLSVLVGCWAFFACQEVVELYPDSSALSRDAVSADGAEVADAVGLDASPADLGEVDVGFVGPPDAGDADSGVIETPDSGLMPSCVCRWIRCRTDPECAVISRTSVCGRDFVCTEATGSCRLAGECGAQAQWSCTVDAVSTAACP